MCGLSYKALDDIHWIFTTAYTYISGSSESFLFRLDAFKSIHFVLQGSKRYSKSYNNFQQLSPKRCIILCIISLSRGFENFNAMPACLSFINDFIHPPERLISNP